MNRRSFLQFRTPSDTEQLQSGIEPYTGSWTAAEVSHLLRRTTFGIRAADVAQLQALSTSQAVDLLLTPPTGIPQPVNHYTIGYGADGLVAVGDTWTDQAVNGFYEFGRMASVKLWLLERMRLQELTIFDKMALFWHNHFALEEINAYPADANDIYHYFTTINQNTLGNFKALTRAITLNPAMLHYLNGILNNKYVPDENYARELQELFTVGKGPDSHYTEDDVKAAARVLTGYRINEIGVHSFIFDSNAHDNTNKQFSDFYGNTIIQGETGTLGASSPPELDNFLNMIFANAEVAKFICRKLYRFFVYHHITPNIETNVIVPLATIFRDNNYEILPVLSALFKSQHFYETLNRACIIKSPVDFVVGLCREFNIPFWTGTLGSDAPWLFPPTGWQLLAVNKYKCAEKLLFECQYENMHLANPPSVAGWPAYYQEPMFYETWINTDTYGKRMEWVYKLCHQGIATDNLWWSNPNSFTLKINHIAFAQSLPNPSDPNALVNDAISRLYSYSVPQNFKDLVKAFLLSGQTSDYYWSSAWADYVSQPTNITFKNIVETRLRDMLTYLLTQAEYQLF